MKRTSLIFPILALLAGACTNPLDFQSNQEADVIILNARLRTDDTTHTVWLSHSLPNTVKPMDDAQLACYVNGEHVADGKLTKIDYSGSDNSPYEFKARIQPGDEVRLEVTCHGLRAQATATAPQPAAITAVVDTTWSWYSADFQTGQDQSLACKLRLQDRPGENNWYRITVSGSADVTRDAEYKDFYGNILPNNFRVDRSIRFSFRDDPILNDGYQDPDSDLSDLLDFFSSAVYNMYCTFSDRAFADSQADVTIHISDYELAYYKYVEYYHHEKSDHLSLHFDLLSLSSDEYLYFEAYNRYDIYGEMTPIYDPICFPSNVEGGLGFFSIASVSRLTLEPVPFTRRDLEAEELYYR